MRASPHPVEFVDRFLKESADALAKPYGVSEAKRATRRKVPSGPQLYSQPNPPSTTTQPELVSNQKAVPPPPVT